MDAEKWTRSVGRAVLLLAQAVTAAKDIFQQRYKEKSSGLMMNILRETGTSLIFMKTESREFVDTEFQSFSLFSFNRDFNQNHFIEQYPSKSFRSLALLDF